MCGSANLMPFESGILEHQGNLRPVPQANFADRPMMLGPFDVRSSAVDRVLSRRAEWSAGLCSLIVLMAVCGQFRSVDFEALLVAVPRSPTFWIAFGGYYLAVPVADWFVLRRLWALSASGAPAVLSKFVANELLVSYSGDAYLYLWVRKAMPKVVAPLSVIKDLAVISALVGSGLTVTGLILVWPILPAAIPSAQTSPLLLSVVVMLASGGLISFFVGRIIKLPCADILFVVQADVARVLAQSACAMLMWHMALPNAATNSLILLSVLRLIVTRLPLVPNKDMVFAAFAVATLGKHSEMVPTLVMISGFVVLAHLVIGGALASSVLVTPFKFSKLPESDLRSTGESGATGLPNDASKGNAQAQIGRVAAASAK